MGCRRSRQDPASLETLLLGYELKIRMRSWHGSCLSYPGTQGLIFVIDSSDRSRIEEARQELHRIILDREVNDALLLVFSNKQDLVGGTKSMAYVWSGRGWFNFSPAMTPQEVQERLKLNQLKNKIWYVMPSGATTGEGLFEGLASVPMKLEASDHCWQYAGLALE